MKRRSGQLTKRRALLGVVPVAASLMVVALAGADTRGEEGVTFGNHSLNGLYEFHADGVAEVNGSPTRGIWEVGRFRADGEGNITDGVEYSKEAK